MRSTHAGLWKGIFFSSRELSSDYSKTPWRAKTSVKKKGGGVNLNKDRNPQMIQ
jgi:hypothetical protein